MKAIVSYINWHLKYLSKLFEKYLYKKPNRSYVKLFNLMLFLKRNHDRLHYDEIQNRYIIKNSKKELIFMNRKYGVDNYRNGLDNRAIEIGNAYMLNEINFNKGDCIIDCGANVGDLLLYFDFNKIYIDYIGIEPSPEEYSCLKENASGHKTLQIALWNEEIEKKFYVDSDGADSSLFMPANFENGIKINCNRLDNLQFNKTHIKLLKLEAEGAEPEIIEGASEILKKTEFVSADVGPERGINSLETYGPVTDLLYKNNFRLIKINTDRLSILYKNNSF